jgi:hypothetical protein
MSCFPRFEIHQCFSMEPTSSGREAAVRSRNFLRELLGNLSVREEARC